jgi:ubiquinone/menaquinone biosynthesis C-methylase UbiE
VAGFQTFLSGRISTFGDTVSAVTVEEMRNMSNQYDADIVAQYDQSFTMMPLRGYVELPSVYQILGDVTGLSILDLACGTGHYTKELRRRGATRAVGVDLSEDMIRATRSREEKERLGVEYVPGDAGALQRLGDFDIVTGIHLLHYANSLEHLNEMCQSVARNLKSGGRFIGYQVNYDLSREPHYYDKYGFNVRIPEQGVDGHPFTFSVTFADYTSPDITAYYWSKESLEAALHNAGLTAIRWAVPAPSPDGIQKHGTDFWADVMRSPFELIVTCRKS